MNSLLPKSRPFILSIITHDTKSLISQHGLCSLISIRLCKEIIFQFHLRGNTLSSRQPCVSFIAPSFVLSTRQTFYFVFHDSVHRWKISRLNYYRANHFNQALEVIHNELHAKTLKCQIALEAPGADGHAPSRPAQAAGLLEEQAGTCQKTWLPGNRIKSLNESNLHQATPRKRDLKNTLC